MSKKQARQHVRELDFNAQGMSPSLQNIFHDYLSDLTVDPSLTASDITKPNLDTLDDKMLLQLALDNPHLLEERLKVVGAQPQDEVLDAIQKALEVRLWLAATRWWNESTEETAWEKTQINKVSSPRRHQRKPRIRPCAKEDLDPERKPTEQRYCLYSQDDKLLGRHSTRSEAVRQEDAIHARQRGGTVEKVAVIKPCKKKDIDPDRPMSEQKICLYTQDGKRLLGRHPSEEAARNQEIAIKARGGKTENTMIKIGNHFYKVAEGFDDKPKGWTKESIKEYVKTLTGNAKHKVTKCIKELKGSDWLDNPDNPAPFCAALMDELEGTGWRRGPRKESSCRCRTHKAEEEMVDEDTAEVLVYKEYPEGRFDDSVAEFVYNAVSHGDGDDALGDDGFGYYNLISFDPPVLVKSDDGDYSIGAAIIETNEDDDGVETVSVLDYETLAEAKKDWLETKSEYNDYLQDAIEDMLELDEEDGDDLSTATTKVADDGDHEDVIIYEKYGPGKFDDNVAVYVYDKEL
jgi:hypothetical protein